MGLPRTKSVTGLSNIGATKGMIDCQDLLIAGETKDSTLTTADKASKRYSASDKKDAGLTTKHRALTDESVAATPTERKVHWGENNVHEVETLKQYNYLAAELASAEDFTTAITETSYYDSEDEHEVIIPAPTTPSCWDKFCACLGVDS